MFVATMMWPHKNATPTGHANWWLKTGLTYNVEILIDPRILAFMFLLPATGSFIPRQSAI